MYGELNCNCLCRIYTFDFGTIWWSGLLLFKMIFKYSTDLKG